MSLTTGRGPLSANPAGRFSPAVPHPVVYVEPYRRRVRGVVADREVIDSDRVLLVHRPGHPPTYAFPAEDVHGAPTESEPEAAGYVRVRWDAVDGWFEEDEPVFGHPRNPFHRIDALRSGRQLRVEVAGAVLVDTTETVLLHETALAPVLYVAARHVRTDLLIVSSTTTYCPYKGSATYWTAVVGEEAVEDVAWSYESPVAEAVPIRGMLCFEAARTTMVADLPA